MVLLVQLLHATETGEKRYSRGPTLHDFTIHSNHPAGHKKVLVMSPNPTTYHVILINSLHLTWLCILKYRTANYPFFMLGFEIRLSIKTYLADTVIITSRFIF